MRENRENRETRSIRQASNIACKSSTFCSSRKRRLHRYYREFCCITYAAAGHAVKGVVSASRFPKVYPCFHGVLAPRGTAYRSPKTAVRISCGSRLQEVFCLRHTLFSLMVPTPGHINMPHHGHFESSRSCIAKTPFLMWTWRWCGSRMNCRLIVQSLPCLHLLPIQRYQLNSCPYNCLRLVL